MNEDIENLSRYSFDSNLAINEDITDQVDANQYATNGPITFT